MFESLVKSLVGWSRKDRGPAYKLAALGLGALFFLALLPGFLLWLFTLLWPGLVRPWPPAPWDKAMALVAGTLGLFFIVWTAAWQWRKGRGTPAPLAPPRKLITGGPYRLCRNPLQLGAACYYLAAGSVIAGLAAGVLLAGAAVLLTWLHGRLVEEKELRARFGPEYERYRRATPFLLPLGPKNQADPGQPPAGHNGKRNQEEG